MTACKTGLDMVFIVYSYGVYNLYIMNVPFFP